MDTPRYAFVSYVDRNYIDGFMALLSSVVLNNPDADFDFVVLHDDLTLAEINRIKKRYHRVVFRRIDTSPYQEFKKGLASNYLVVKAYFILEAFRLVEYDTIICLDTDMVVLGPIDNLFEIGHPFAACPQFFNPDGGRNLNSGLLVISKPVLSEDTWAALCEIGRAGTYELEKHDQAILSEYFNGKYHQLPSDYNFVKRRLQKTALPSSVKVLHFTGRIKPWNDVEVGYEPIQKHWENYNLDDISFLQKLIRSAIAGRKYDLAVFAARQHVHLERLPGNSVLDVFPALRAQKLWDEALALLQASPLSSNEKDYPRYLRYLGEVHTALDETAGTGAMYLAASLHSGQRTDKLLADAYWVAGRLEPAQLMAESCLAQNPASRGNRVLQRRIELSRTLDAQAAAARETKALGHVAFYMTRQGNAGDILLPWSVRGALESAIGPTSWAPFHVHQRVSDETVARLNDTRGVIIGGGGLFLADTGANRSSGWQWNIDTRKLAKINVPISVFAVGYNQFYGQGHLSQLFADSITLLLEKASFFGLRNSGSINEAKSYIPESLRSKVAYQPCPTTVLAKTHEKLFDVSRREEYIALNIALDRPQLRFGGRYEDFLAQIGAFIREISKEVQIRYFAHAVVDEQFLIDLAKYEGLALHAVRLYDLTEEEMVRLYQKPKLVIGMRGHAGMIPFGCRTPIISLVTHPKLRYFLEDVRMPECAIDVEGAFADALVTQTRTMLSNHDDYVARVDAEIARLWDITRKNVTKIQKSLGK